MDSGLGPMGEASGPVAFVGVPQRLEPQPHSEGVAAGWADLGLQPHEGPVTEHMLSVLKS